MYWCNLACWLWHVRLRLDCPGLDAVSFMDDRLLSSTHIIDLDAGLFCTAGVDATFGSGLNLTKTKWATTSRMAVAPGPRLVAFTLVLGIK